MDVGDPYPMDLRVNSFRTDRCNFLQSCKSLLTPPYSVKQLREVCNRQQLAEYITVF